uniref:Uncharacterized protein n=1 Tax=Rangifer tarandus platyrhynchus TaxID=3082113 RepID=A0ACB0E007_RANTA|nr:unnamed protein product [Rangifer tarandus platyrhynchus]
MHVRGDGLELEGLLLRTGVTGTPSAACRGGGCFPVIPPLSGTSPDLHWSHTHKCSQQRSRTPSKAHPRSSSSEALETNLSDKKRAWSGARELGKATRTMGYVTICVKFGRETQQ